MGDSNDAFASIDAADLEWCHDVVEDVSRTFAISIDLLEEPTSSTLCVGYLVCRIADTVEDAAALPAEQKDDLLATYDRVLDPGDPTSAAAFVDAVEDALDAAASDGSTAGESDGHADPPGDGLPSAVELARTGGPSAADWRLVTDAERVVATYEGLPPAAREAVAPPARELVGGMRTFVRRYADEPGIRIQTADELTEYCYYVAGVIGHLVTNVQCWSGDVERDPERMRALAESFGQLLQLVNVAKDVHADFVEEDNVYLPAAWLDDVGVPQSAVLDPEHEQAVASVVERTAERARGYLDDAQAWIEALAASDESVVAACSVPFLLAVGTLRELSARPADALSAGGVKLSREEVVAIVAAVTTDFDQSDLGSLRERVRRGELPGAGT